MTASLLNFRNCEINGRFVTNLEPKLEIEHGRVKRHNKIFTLGKKFEKWLKSKCKMFILVVVARYTL